MPITPNVAVEQLKSNTKIIEFTKFANPDSKMEEKVCKFIQHNLRGASTEVERSGKTVVCQVEQKFLICPLLCQN